MNPLFPLPYLIVVFLLLAAGLGWAAWRSTEACSLAMRVGVVLLRCLGVLALSIPFLNPGAWHTPRQQPAAFWAILVDRSQSMALDVGEADEGNRWEAALGVVRKIKNATNQSKDMPLRWFPFASTLESEVPGAPQKAVDGFLQLTPDGPATDVIGAVATAVDRFATTNPSLGGIVVLSDGRVSVDKPLRDAVTRCRAAGVSVFALPMGEATRWPDLRLRLPKRNFLAFKDQEVLIPVEVEGENFPPSAWPVRLQEQDTTAEGRMLEEQQVEIIEGQRQSLKFRLPDLSPGVHNFVVETPPMEGEIRTGDNRLNFSVQVLDRAVRVLLVEGSPYWDTKFIAQLLQKEKDYRFEVVYRLSEERFFSLEGGQAGGGSDEPGMVERSVFPNSAEELADFDLLIFGRNVDPFLDENRVRNIRQWIEENGGALILARGNPLTSPRPVLEEVFPTAWDRQWKSDFRWRPTRIGEEAGLFGSDLPAADSPVWERLPQLREAEYGSQLRPFSQVLVEGVGTRGESEAKFPAVLSRRVGEGLVVSIQTGDLWRWDFFPQIPEAEKIYRDFWFQLFHWTIAYSEFLPGKDFALKPSSSRVRAGEPVRLRVQRRARTHPNAEPVITWKEEDQAEKIILPVAVRGQRDAWEVILVPEHAGIGRVSLQVPEVGTAGELHTSIEVMPTLTELGQPDPDAAFLEQLAVATGGRLLTAEDLDNFPPESIQANTDLPQGPSTWKPAWTSWLWLLPLLGFFSLEWLLRRRNGLI